ncbi:putative RNA recognition motif domain, nucleotide-binding alpha-beta plait domain superfamily [Helianthus anomalus]
MGSNNLTSVAALTPGSKIFIGGLAKDTTIDTFVKYFGKYGDLTDSVIMKDRQTGRPTGFGFVTYADPSVVDTVIAETHVINGKQVSEFLFLGYFGYE